MMRLLQKRQYTTHINISETLKDLIKDAQPDPRFIALDQLNTHEKRRKNKWIDFKKLFKVVIDDTLYEISCVMDYVEYLKRTNKTFRVNSILSEKSR